MVIVKHLFELLYITFLHVTIQLDIETESQYRSLRGKAQPLRNPPVRIRTNQIESGTPRRRFDDALSGKVNHR